MKFNPSPIDPRKRGISAIEQQLWAIAAKENTKAHLESVTPEEWEKYGAMAVYYKMGTAIGPEHPHWHGDYS